MTDDGRCTECGRGPVTVKIGATVWATKECYDGGHPPVFMADPDPACSDPLCSYKAEALLLTDERKPTDD